MTPIINPWWFYAMEVCETLKVICSVFSGLGGVAFLVIALLDILDGIHIKAKYTKLITYLFVVTILLSVLLPSEKTLTKMLIAQNITYERVEIATDTVEQVYNDIMDLIEDEEVEE